MIAYENFNRPLLLPLLSNQFTFYIELQVENGLSSEVNSAALCRLFNKRINYVMKKTPLPTVQQIEELTVFLPRLYAEGFSPVLHWYGGKQKDGTLTFPYPDYDPLVQEFFSVAANQCWRDYDYNPEQGHQMLANENFVKTASLAQIKSMLTFCVRGERFSDGHWEEMIEKGYIRRLLERLNEIKAELSHSQ